MDKMGCALIGLGYWGSILKKYIENSDKLELVETYSRRRTDISYEDILHREDIKAVFICTNLDSHYELVKKAILAGKHVFCEKPLACDFEKCRELFDLAHDKSVTLYTDYIYTQSESIKEIKEHWKELGEVKSIRMELSQYGKFYEDSDVIGIIGVHMLSVLAYLFDYDLEISNIDKKEYVSDMNGHCLDSVVQFDVNRVECSLVVSLLSPKKARRITIVGTRGCAQFDMLEEQTVSVVSYQSEQCGVCEIERYSYEYDEGNNLSYVVEDFVRSVRERKVDSEECCLSVEKMLKTLGM